MTKQYCSGPLLAGHRVSFHGSAMILGTVLRVYRNGWAMVQWDDRTRTRERIASLRVVT
jgi:hypothetical protein